MVTAATVTQNGEIDVSSEPELSLMIFHRRKAHIFRRGSGSLWRDTTMSSG